MILLAVVIWTALRFEQLPLIMTTHWDFVGQANGFMEKTTGAFVVPLVMVLLWALWELLPAMDRRHCSSRNFLKAYWSMGSMMLLILGGLQWGVVQANLDVDFPLVRFLGWLFVLIMAWMGRMLYLVPRNPILGIRTPWSLASSRVWRLTHLEAARGLRGGALLSILFQVLLPSPWNLAATLVVFVAILLWGAVLSFLLRD